MYARPGLCWQQCGRVAPVPGGGKETTSERALRLRAMRRMEVVLNWKSSSTRVGSSIEAVAASESAECAGVAWLQMSAMEAAFMKESVPMKVPSVLMPPTHWWMRSVVSGSGPSSSDVTALHELVSHAGDHALVLAAPKLTCRFWATSSLRKSTKAAATSPSGPMRWMSSM